MICRISWDTEIECNQCQICAGKIIPLSREMPIGKIEWMIEEIIEAGRIDMSIRRNGEHIEIKLTQILDIHDAPIESMWKSSKEIMNEIGGQITEIGKDEMTITI